MPAPPASPTASSSAARICSRRRSREADVLTLYLTAGGQPPAAAAHPRRRCARARAWSATISTWATGGRTSASGSAPPTIYLWIVPARVAGRWTLTADGRTAHARRSSSATSRFDGTDRDGGAPPRRAGPGSPATASASSPISATAGASSKAGSTATASSRASPDAGWQAVRARLTPRDAARPGRPRPRLGGDAAVRRHGVRPRPAAARSMPATHPRLRRWRALVDRAGRRRRPARRDRLSAPASCSSAATGAAPSLLLGDHAFRPAAGRAAEGLDGAAAAGRAGASRRRSNPRFPERPCRQRDDGLALPRLAAADAASAAAPVAVWAAVWLALAVGAEPGDARRPLAERRDRRLGVRPFWTLLLLRLAGLRVERGNAGPVDIFWRKEDE